MHDIPKHEPPALDAPASTIQLHGVLVRVFATGVLLTGESGIGKSECALDLVTKGHSLVADDVVQVLLRDGSLIGTAPDLTFELLEIRGLGIINVRELFGENAVTAATSIDLCVDLRTKEEVDRLKPENSDLSILNRSIPRFVLPVRPGRNLSTLILTAVKLFLNRETGSASAELIARHEDLLRSDR